MTELSITQYVNQDAVLKNIQDVLKERSPQFVTSMVSLVNSSEQLKSCDKKSIMAACLTAAALNLPVNPSLGMAYIIPYGGIAQFQIGWKGLVDLAIRTKRYKHINVSDVREGEFGQEDPLRGTIQFNWISNREERAKAAVIGYVGYFQLTEGFEKILYMSVDELEVHATKYSQSYRNKSSKTNQWRDDKPGMSKKTVLKLLINRFGPKNAELRQALEADQSAIDERGGKYVDNQPVDHEAEADRKERERIERFMKNATTVEQLEKCEEALFSMEDNSDLLELFKERKEQLSTVS